MPLPKYHQIYLVLREQLREGRFDQGLPGELRLMQQFDVARVTIRRALEQLACEGLITREPGRGSWPSPRPSSPEPSAAEKVKNSRLTGLLENLVSMGLHTSVKVIDLRVISAPRDVAAALCLAAGAAVQKAVRVRSTKAGPLSQITTYVPEHIGRHFGRKELAKKPILLLMQEVGVKVGRAEQRISACLADAEVARQLGVTVGSALLAVRRLIYDDQDHPIQWLHGLYRPDRYEYAMQLSRVGDIDAQVWVSKELSAQFH